MDFNVNGYNIFLMVGVTFLASLIFVEMMKRVAVFLKVLDYPNDKRKIHTKPMPMLGGIGIFLAFLLCAFLCRSLPLRGPLLLEEERQNSGQGNRRTYAEVKTAGTTSFSFLFLL